MAGLNRVQLLGNLGKDPEPRFTPKGTKFCTFSIAVNRRWKAGDGALKESTDWFNIEAWGRLGETCQQYLRKGSRVYLEGRLHTSKYEHEGETRTSTKIMANLMIMVERRGGIEPVAGLDYEVDEETSEE